MTNLHPRAREIAQCVMKRRQTVPWEDVPEVVKSMMIECALEGLRERERTDNE